MLIQQSPAIRHDILDFCGRELVTFGKAPHQRQDWSDWLTERQAFTEPLQSNDRASAIV
jgi:hypothetical protein